MPFGLDLECRLLAKREIDPGRGCWLWTGCCEKQGYGKIKLGGRNGRFRKVHRVAAMLWLDIDLDGPTQVLHHCDVRRCFNPAHLYGGTNADNIRDRTTRKRGREHRQCGAAHHKAKLSDDDVWNIRRRVEQGELQCRIADEYGIRSGHVSKIVSRTSWGHLE